MPAPQDPAPRKVELQDRGGYLEARLWATRSVTDIKRQAEELLAASRELKGARLLVDMREIPGPMSTLERYDLGRLAAKFSPAFSRVAILAVPGLIDPQKFAVQVAQNRGLQIDIFTDADQALRWLLA